MPDSPIKNSSGVISYSIKAAGSAIKDSIRVVSIDVYKAVNAIATAMIVIQDGDMPEKDFPISNEDTFKPGNEIEIAVGYGGDNETIFKGVIIRHGISIAGHNDSRLIIECKDKAVGMTLARRSNNYVKKKDSDIISALIGNCSGTSSDVKATSTQFQELVQFNSTDWDFMLTRAEANGYVVCTQDNKITVKPPQTDKSAVLKVTYGEDLMEFHADIDARHQLKSVTGISWDIKNQKVITEKAAIQTLNSQGDLDASELSKVLGFSEYRMQTSVLEKGALKDWASGQQVKSALSRIRGAMTFQGSAKADIDCLIEVNGVGNRFNGDVYVSAIHHSVTGGQWLTEAEFGMSPCWSAENRDLAAPSASGLLPGVEGLQIGVVKKLDGDPEEQNRIQVSVPVLQAETEGVWARLATYYASSEFGNFFIPEPGDEVVLGYFNNNPSEPVILGSLYSSKNKPPYTIESENDTKAIVTRSKLKIEFNEKDKITTIITPGENKIVISDKDQSILLQDQNDNKVELASGGITLDTPKDIKASAKGDISLEATGKISLSSKGDMSLDGMNVKVTAKAALTAKGSSTAEFSASGQTTVKGAMVAIN
ncbi:type VI secretion system tip protein VgrG [Oceanospirillum sediminis]|uniref:Type VI secretion system tip protein VgrG n=1 Tax=Oceanospirillum sediminis TaxID=2760088 RepID=A0A839IR69_9GAMM|nr:type VI secretion system tip protein VgrG [Oceanospirillum sediminis]MBB1487164.1 type VI secretion system tip protein VgrG [Oceanospirillum sediminis]